MSNDCLGEIDEDLKQLREREKQQVRDFIERLVSTMLGGDVDDTCVTKLYNDSQCKQHFIDSTAKISFISLLWFSTKAVHIFILNKYFR